MTKEQLKSLIESDPEALAMAEARPSRASVLFGLGFVIEVSDLVALRAEELI